MKILQWGPELHVDGWIDGRKERQTWGS